MTAYNLPEYEPAETQGDNIRHQFAEFARQVAEQPNQTTELTWGYEIESNTMKNVRAEVNRRGLPDPHEWQQDGSVSDYASDGCECSCDDCSHSCDCDYCDRADYSEHCGDDDCSGVQEVASIGGLTDTHPIGLDSLALAGINKATFESDCGIHIHIGSAHLTAPQVANLMTAYRLAQPVLNQIAERAGNHYSANHTPEDEDNARRGLEPSSRYYAVNVANHFKTYGTRTIEFRQMAGHTEIEDIRQSDRVRAWSHLLRLLTAYATKPAPQLYWLGKVKDLNDLLRLIG